MKGEKAVSNKFYELSWQQMTQPSWSMTFSQGDMIYALKHLRLINKSNIES